MQKAGNQIIIGIISGSIVLLMLGLFIFLFLLYYQRKHNTHIEEKSSMRQVFEENLAQTQIEVQEQTRKNLAVDLHDNIGQLLSLTNVTLASINLNFVQKASDKIEDAQQLVSRSIQELRRLSRVLQGEQLLKDGLVSAIRQDVQWMVGKGYYTIHFNAKLEEDVLEDEEINLFVYRIYQESLNNILKHSGADTITVDLSYEDKYLLMSIGDNGQGFDEENIGQDTKGIGLFNMKKRAELLGGTMEIQSVLGKGTVLYFKLLYHKIG
jgi:signal transduction histidine kinase